MYLRSRLYSLLSTLLLACIALHAAASVADPGLLREAASLDDPRFAPAVVREGRRKLSDFQQAVGGLYVIGPFERDRVHVVFIHGINGSPRDFRYFIAHLDRNAFQVSAFFYASSGALDDVTQQLATALAQFSSHYDVDSIVIVAHSMGGLIARQLIVNELETTRVQVPLLITLSTPWEGHAGAAVGARLVPGTRLWHDIATGSDYLAGLFEAASGGEKRMPARTQHHLLFSYRKSWIALGRSGDQVVSVASQLSVPAQEQAYRIYGFDTTHVGILRDPDVDTLLTQLLESRVETAPATIVSISHPSP